MNQTREHETRKRRVSCISIQTREPVMYGTYSVSHQHSSDRPQLGQVPEALLLLLFIILYSYPD